MALRSNHGRAPQSPYLTRSLQGVRLVRPESGFSVETERDHAIAMRDCSEAVCQILITSDLGLGPQRGCGTESAAHAGHCSLGVRARDYRGLAYSSRFDATLTCWAIFEGAAFEPVGSSEPILPNDPDLMAMAKRLGLSL